MSDEETVLTTRRALLHTGGRRWTPGRLRVTDRRVAFTPAEGERVEVALAVVTAVRLLRGPRRSLQLETPDGPIRLRCFAMPAVLALLRR